MTALQAWTRLINLGIKTCRRAGIDDLRRFFMAGQQHIGHAYNRFRRECCVKFTFGQINVSCLQGEFIALPASQAASQNRDIFNAKCPQHPPCPRGREQVTFIVYHQVLILVHA